MTPEISAEAGPVTSAAASSRWRLDPRLHSPLWITLVLLVGHVSAGILESPSQLVLAIAAAVAAELLLGRVTRGSWPTIASPYMTGASVGMLLRSPEYWPFAWCAVVSIMSKYVIRLDGRHVFNPSNFGISLLLLVYPAHAAHLSVQWGNSLVAIVMVWSLTLIVLMRWRILHICLTYVAAFVLLAYPRSLVTGHSYLTEVAPITGPMYQLYVLLMITDPKTSVRSRGGQMAMVACVAALEAVLRSLPTFLPASALVQNLAVHAPFYALFVVGPSFYVRQILRDRASKNAGPTKFLRGAAA
jgi:hypothetical protein